MKPAFRFVKQVFKEFSHDKVGQLSAALAYVAVFSIGPLLLVVISLVGFIYGERAAQGQLYSQLSSSLGPSTAKTVQDLVAHLHNAGGGALALVFGAIGMLLGAAGVTTQVQNSFDTIFSVAPDPKAGLKRTIYVKLKNILLVIIGGLVVVVSLIISALVNSLGKQVQNNLGIPPIVLEVVNNLVSAVVFAGIIYLIYKVLSNVELPRKVAANAAVWVTLLFLVGKIILAVVIGNNGTASAYGAAASLVTLLLWLNYSGQILFLGAEGIKVYGLNHSLIYQPKKYNLKRHSFTVEKGGFANRLLTSIEDGIKRGIVKK